MQTCQSLEEIRSCIDGLDRQIVTLLAERGGYVRQAALFKRTSAEVHAPARVEQVLEKVRKLAQELGAHVQVTEAVYRSMIAAFIEAELAEHASLAGQRN